MYLFKATAQRYQSQEQAAHAQGEEDDRDGEEEAEDEEPDDSEEDSESDNDKWPTQEEFDSWLKTTRQLAKDAEESHCYVSRRHRTRFPRRNFPAAVLEAKTVIVTCGMKNFEFSSYSNATSKKFRSHLSDRRVEVDHFARYPEDKRIF